jgi:hypothetical protein
MSKVGFLERFNFQMVAGWVPAENKGDEVKIEFNGQKIVTVVADIDRPDTGVTCYGFACAFPSELLDTGNVTVNVYYNDQEITNSPRNIVTDASELKKVLYGKDGWLFLTNDTNESLGYLTGHQPVKESIVDLWVERISQRNTDCDAYGIKCFHMIVPEKEVVYRDYLPDGLAISPDRPVVKLMEALEEVSIKRVLYPDYEKCENRMEQLVYSKGDTHWTHDGAYFAVKELFELMDDCGVQLPPKNAYTFKQGFQASDLLIKTTAFNMEAIQHTGSISSKIKKIFSNNVKNADRREEFINFDAPKVRFMCWHTSSVDWMKPFFNDMFGNTCYIWGSSINWNEVLRYRPDVLLFQTNERFLTRVPNDINLEKS